MDFPLSFLFFFMEVRVLSWIDTPPFLFFRKKDSSLFFRR